VGGGHAVQRGDDGGHGAGERHRRVRSAVTDGEAQPTVPASVSVPFVAVSVT
jgi:hypothetical protein